MNIEIKKIVARLKELNRTIEIEYTAYINSKNMDRLTDKFEELHSGREWDGEWFDTLEDFLYKELAL